MSRGTGQDKPYFRHYQLGKDPFPADTFDNLLFLTPELVRRLDRVKQLVGDSDRIVLVSGAPGAGKSIIADYLESIPESSWKACLLQANADMDRETFAHEIIRQVSPDRSDDPAYAITQMHKFLEHASNAPLVPVIIIDDAHLLPADTLEFVFELAALRYAESLFRFVLFAEEVITDRLDAAGLAAAAREAAAYVILPPLSRKQTREYIDNRLSSCGGAGEYPFSDAEIDEMYRFSAGLPGGINRLARKSMMAKLGPPGWSSGKRQLLAGSAAVAALALAAFFLLSGDDGTSPAVSVAPARPLAGDLESRSGAAAPSADSTPVPEPATIPPATALEDRLDAPRTDVPGTEDGEILIADSGEYGEPLPAGTPAGGFDDGDYLGPSGAAGIEDTIQYDEPMPEQTAGAAEPAADVDMAGTALDTETFQDAVPPPADQAAATPARQAPPLVTGDGGDNIYHLDDIPGWVEGIRGESWYRLQSASSYALQLISASELVNVEKLLNGLPGIQANLSGYVKYTPSGRPRYLLFYGNYPDADAAREAIASIPPGLREVQPWPRTIGSILGEIEQVKAGPYGM